MGNVVSFTNTSKKQRAKELMTPFNVEAEVEKDVDKLCKATGITKEEAVKLASDFYEQYPILIEYIRSDEYRSTLRK